MDENARNARAHVVFLPAEVAIVEPSRAVISMDLLANLLPTSKLLGRLPLII
jgi:hypothetical protein